MDLNRESGPGRATKADLAICKASKCEAAIWAPGGKDPRVHHAREGRGVPEGIKEGVGDEALRCLLRRAQHAACQAGAADVEAPGHANGQRALAVTQYIRLHRRQIRASP